MSTFDEYNIPFQPTSSKRKRKKQIINDVKKQVSFYFSDSNLSKDKFLRSLMKDDPEGYVPIDTIKSFSRITELSCTDKLFLKAVSMIPELSLDENKTKIKRCTPINDLYRADDRTIYIENLPQRMDHKRLENALSKYGTIMHISLPRFKNNREFKGFGFVEFQTVEETQKALKGLGWDENESHNILQNTEEILEPKPEPMKSDTTQKMEQCTWPPVLPESDESSLLPRDIRDPPKNLMLSDSITPNITPSITPDTPASETDTKEGKEEHKKKRRRRRSSICISELKMLDQCGAAVKSHDHGTSENRDPLLLVNTKCEIIQPVLPARKRKRTSLENPSPTTHRVKRLASSCSESDTPRLSDTPRDTSDVEMKKKLKLAKAKRRKKRKQKLKAKTGLQEIRVLPKGEWVKLKMVYKQLQKQQISAIKQDLGMKRNESNAIKLCGLPQTYSEDHIKAMFKDAVVSVYNISAHDAFVRFTTNPESYKTAVLPSNVSIRQLTESEHEQLNDKINIARKERYTETKKKKKLRGYTKVIKKCSAQDQTSQEPG